MAAEPMTLFARIANPALVAERLRELAPKVEIDGTDEAWSNAVVSFSDGPARLALTFTHDPEYYSEPNWSKQMAGMRGYFSEFPETDRKQRAMLLTTSFKFSLGTLLDPEIERDDDPRWEVLFAVVEILDGVIFTPSSFRDAKGRVLFGTGGEDEEDPDAKWPRVIGEVSVTEPFGAAMHQSSQPNPPDENDLVPPTANQVARRTLALTAVTARAMLEQHPKNLDSLDSRPEQGSLARLVRGALGGMFKPNRSPADLLSWIDQIGITNDLEPDEWEVIQRPLGRLDPIMHINSTWRLEGLVVLAWSLGLYDIPPHDELVDFYPMWRNIGLLDAKTAKGLLANPVLRSRDEIKTIRSKLFSIHWRIRNYELRPEAMDFAEFARTCWFGPLDISGWPLVKGDLGIQGIRIDQVDADLLGRTRSAARERHVAANWLWGGPERYSDASDAT